MVEFLDFILPVARRENDSCMVLIDRLSAHLAEEIKEIIVEKGHCHDVLGGGTTAAQQVPDVMRNWGLKKDLRDIEDVDYRNQRIADETRLPHTDRQGIADRVDRAMHKADYNHIGVVGSRKCAWTIKLDGTEDHEIWPGFDLSSN